METKILLLCLFSLVAHSEEAPLNFGIYGGANFAYMEGSEIDALEVEYDSPAETIPAGNGGLRVGYAPKTWLEVETGVLLAGNGFQILLDSEGGTNWTGGMPREVKTYLYSVRRVTTLEFPIALKLRTPTMGSAEIRLFGFGGLRGAVVVSAVERVVQETVTSNFPNEGNTKDRHQLDRMDLFENETITDQDGNTIHYSYDDFYRRGNTFLFGGAGIEKRYWNLGFFLVAQYVYGVFSFNKLSDTAKKEIAAYNSPETSSGVVFLGEPESFFRNAQISGGLNFYFP